MRVFLAMRLVFSDCVAMDLALQIHGFRILNPWIKFLKL